MLRQRIITAVILLLVVFALLATKNILAFNLFMAVVAGVALWEWLRIVTRHLNLHCISIIIAVVATLFYGYTALYIGNDTEGTQFQALMTNYGTSLITAMAVTAILWLIVVPLLVIKGDTARVSNPWLHGIFAILSATTVWFSMVFLYQFGAVFLISFMSIVWVTDIFAYFGGRHFGGKKLAPKVSPGKTLSGAICGALSAVIWTVGMSYIDHAFSHHFKSFGIVALIFIGLVFAILSIFGDLYESLLKRRADVKDSSHLLPGHGGFFDRIDGLIPVAPLAGLLLLSSLLLK